MKNETGYGFFDFNAVFRSIAVKLHEWVDTKPVVVPVPDISTFPDFYYVTYTKYNKSNGYMYVGRSSGYGDPQSIVNKRDIGHHMSPEYGPAKLSTSIKSPTKGFWFRLGDPSYWAIRGSEQMQIQAYRKLGISGNDRNGIDPNKTTKFEKYMQAARDLLE